MDKSEHILTLISEAQIAARNVQLGQEISKFYGGSPIAVICVLKGSFMFAADLVRHISLPLRMDFLGVSSYGDETETSGAVRITQDLSQPIEGEDILIVEDIVDTGLTLAYLIDLLKARKPKSIRVCSLLHKPARSRVDVNIDFLGFTIEDKFVVGYGLDWAQKCRNLPYIGYVVKP